MTAGILSWEKGKVLAPAMLGSNDESRARQARCKMIAIDGACRRRRVRRCYESGERCVGSVGRGGVAGG